MRNVAKNQSLRRPHRTRLQVEELESRTLLSVYTPANIRAAYGFNGLSQTGAGQTIAIVDAYNDPNILSDATTFNSTFSLQQFYPLDPTGPTFTQVNQTGGTSLPAGNTGWGGEISLDVEWAHAIAPQANILLVEATTNSLLNLLAAVDYASAHANVVSMSWGAKEFSSETSYDSHFTTPGVTYVASSGDNGAGVSWPAISPNVLSVGGTTLNYAVTSTTETAWSGSGGGISGYESLPSYQSGLGYSKRTNPDVAYDANPNTGYYVYDSYGYSGLLSGVGGTSAGAPQWAGLVALANQARTTPLSGSTQTLPALYNLYASGSYTTSFRDITSGSNGTRHTGYSAKTGYDLVTGLGTPHADQIVPYLASYTATTATSTSSGSTSSGSTSGSSGGHHHSVTSAPVDGNTNGFTALPFAVGLSTQSLATTSLLSQSQLSAAVLPGTLPVTNSASANGALPLLVSGSITPSVSIVGGEEDSASVNGTVEPNAPTAPAAPAIVQPATVAPRVVVPAAGQDMQRGVERNMDNNPRMPKESEESEEASLPDVLVGSRSAFAGIALVLGGYWTLPRDEEEERKRAWSRLW